MKRVALLVIALAVIAATGYTTAPMIRDIPDIRLLTGAINPGTDPVYQTTHDTNDTLATGSVATLSIDDYVTSFQTPKSMLDWSTSTADFGGTSPVTIAGSAPNRIAQIAGNGTAAIGVVNWHVHDTSEEQTDDATSTVKYSDFWLQGPSILVDHRIDADATAVAYNWALVGSNPSTTSDLKALVYPTSQSSLVSLSVTIADKDGLRINPDGGDVTTATAGGLTALINGDGTLTLTGSSSLTEPLLVGIKAANGASWDGTTLQASQALVPGGKSLTGPEVNRFSEFEDYAPGLLPTSGTVKNEPYIGWYVMAPSTSVVRATDYQATVVAGTTMPAGLQGAGNAWAYSGNVLKLELKSGKGAFRLVSDYITGIVPGGVYTWATNLAITNTGATTTTYPDFYYGWYTFEAGSNATYNSMSKGNTSSGIVEEEPFNSWRRIAVTLYADKNGSQVRCATSQLYNMYVKGYQLMMIVVPKATVATNYPIQLWLDHSAVYKDVSVLDAMRGANQIQITNADPSVIPAQGAGATTLQFYGNWEADGGTLAANGNWDFGGASKPAYVAMSTSQDHTQMFSQFGSTGVGHALLLHMADATSRTNPGGSLKAKGQNSMDLNTNGVSGRDNSGKGIFAVECYVKTDANPADDSGLGGPAECPNLIFQFQQAQFKAINVQEHGFFAAPQVDQGWKHVVIPLALKSSKKVTFVVSALAPNPVAMVGNKLIRGVYSGMAGYGTPNHVAGYAATASVWVDDVKVYKVSNEDIRFFDRSVFP